MTVEPTENNKMKFIRNFPRFTALLIGCIVSIFIMLFLEGLCYVLNIGEVSKKRSIIKNVTHGYYQDDYILGYKPGANIEALASMTNQGETIYEVTYSIDAYCRRITPVENRTDRNRYAIFFGGSYTFGEGVENNQTLPAYFSNVSSSYMPYNYGFHGYGPHHMLAKLIAVNLETEIQEKTGILIYLYLPDHINRVIGSMHVYNTWGKSCPYYTIDAQNNLIRKESFFYGRPYISMFYDLLGRSNFIKYFKINFPLRLSDRHYRLTTKVIEESRKEFQKQFENDHFYVVLYPSEVKTRENARRIIPYFEKANIKYLDYTDLFDPGSEEFTIKSDGHPTPKAYEILAKKLSQDVSSLQRNEQ